MHQHLYITKWCDTKMAGRTNAQILAIGPDEWTVRAPAMACHRFKCMSLPLLHQKPEAALCNGGLAVVVVGTAKKETDTPRHATCLAAMQATACRKGGGPNRQ